MRMRNYCKPAHINFIELQRSAQAVARNVFAMSLESALRSICGNGKESDSIAEIRCSPLFNMRRVIATRETVQRICGFGECPSDRCLDDLVGVILDLTC